MTETPQKKSIRTALIVLGILGISVLCVYAMHLAGSMAGSGSAVSGESLGAQVLKEKKFEKPEVNKVQPAPSKKMGDALKELSVAAS